MGVLGAVWGWYGGCRGWRGVEVKKVEEGEGGL